MAQDTPIEYSPLNHWSTRIRLLNHRVKSVKTLVHIGCPDRARISTSHVERTNLSVRLFNRRFTRLTLGYSKKLQNLKYAVALFVAHFNFCRIHSAHKQTPAMAAGLTDRVWTVSELLNPES